MVLNYTGASKTVTLKEALAYTIATTDKVYILAENSLKSTVANRQLDVTATGAAGLDWANVENPTTAVDLSGTDIQLVDTASTVTDGLVATDIVSDGTAIDTTAGAVDNVTLTDTVTAYTGNTPQTADNDTKLTALSGTDGKALISTDAQDLSGTLDVNTKTLTAGSVDTTVIAAGAILETKFNTGAISARAIETDAIGASELSATAVTEIVNGVFAHVMAELAAIPSATPTLEEAIMIKFMALRNKQTGTAAAQTIANDAGATIATAVLSDAAGTTTKEEYS
jgi:hypothetical protein